MKQSVREKIERARFELYLRNPFLASIFYKFRIVVFPPEKAKQYGLWAAGIREREKLVAFNESFVESVDLDTLVFVFAHEAMHYLLDSSSREILADKYPDIYNMAQDFVINTYLYEARIGFFNPDSPIGYINNETFEWSSEELPGYQPFYPLYDRKFFNWTTEEVFKYLLEKLQKTKFRSGSGKGGHEGASKEKEKSRRKGAGGGEEVVYVDDEGIERRPIDVVEDRPENEKEREEMKKDVAEAVNASYSRGYNPYGDSMLREFIEAALRPRLPWRALLQRFIYRNAKFDYSWNIPSKVYYSTGIYLPSVRSQTATFVVAVDCSGSITTEDLQQFIAEVYSLVAQFPSFDLWILAFTTQIDGIQRITFAGQKVNFEIFKVTGGTNYTPIFEFIEKNSIRPDAVVVLTDLECGPECFPRRPPAYPVLWVCNQPRAPYIPPFGEIVYMK